MGSALRSKIQTSIRVRIPMKRFLANDLIWYWHLLPCGYILYWFAMILSSAVEMSTSTINDPRTGFSLLLFLSCRLIGTVQELLVHYKKKTWLFYSLLIISQSLFNSYIRNNIFFPILHSYNTRCVSCYFLPHLKSHLKFILVLFFKYFVMLLLLLLFIITYKLL